MPCVSTHEKLMMKTNKGKRERKEEYSKVVIKTVT